MNAVTTSRPVHVTIAVVILCIALVNGLVLAAINFAFILPEETPQMVATIGIVFAVITVCIGAFFIYKIFTGRNWARIVFLIFFIIGLAFAAPTAIGLLSMFPVMGMLNLIGLAARVVALVLLFTAASNQWFQQPST